MIFEELQDKLKSQISGQLISSLFHSEGFTPSQRQNILPFT